MLKRLRLILIFLLAVVGLGIYLSSTSESIFFATAREFIVRSIVAGVVLGGARAVVKGKPEIVAGEVNRHDAGSFLSHWGTAIGIFILIASGVMFGFFPSSSKVLTEEAFALNLHYIGVVITLFCGLFWAVDFTLSRSYNTLVPNIKDIIHGTLGKYLLRREWRCEGKYLSSQKSAFLAFASVGAVILATGAIKVAAYIWPIQAALHGTITFIHDVSSLLFILLLIVHVTIVIVLGHWLALKSWFTGKMPEEHVKKEHPVWYEELQRGIQNDNSKQKPCDTKEVCRVEE